MEFFPKNFLFFAVAEHKFRVGEYDICVSSQSSGQYLYLVIIQ